MLVPPSRFLPHNPNSLHKSAFVRAIKSDRRGSVVTIFALVLPLLVGILGITVDYARASVLRQKLIGAADSASLLASRAVADGQTVAVATDLASQFWLKNTQGIATLAPPTVSVVKAGDVVTTTVSYTSSIDTTFSRLLGITTIPVDGTSIAQASSMTNNNAKKFSGYGGVWGDPHLVGADGHNTTFRCPRPSWYDLLSDGGVEVNVACASYADYDMISDMTIMIGGHTIGLGSAMIDAKTGTMLQPGWTNQITIDGVATSTALGTTELAHWPEGSVTAKMTTLNYTQTKDDGSTNSIVISTPNYKIVLGFAYASGYGSWGWTWITANNAGTCGIPGGLFGDTLGGVDDYHIADFAVPTAATTQSAFDRTPCDALVASGLRLIK